MEEVCIKKLGARGRAYSANGAPMTPLRSVLPSEHARADVGREPVFRLVNGTASSFAPSTAECVDFWPVASARP